LCLSQLAEQSRFLRTGDVDALPARKRGFEGGEFAAAQGVMALERGAASVGKLCGVERETAVAVAQVSSESLLAGRGHGSFHRSA